MPLKASGLVIIEAPFPKRVCYDSWDLAKTVSHSGYSPTKKPAFALVFCLLIINSKKLLPVMSQISVSPDYLAFSCTQLIIEPKRQSPLIGDLFRQLFFTFLSFIFHGT